MYANKKRRKSVNKLGIERINLNTIKAIYHEPTARE
jgi:hypothetical protein